MVKYYTYLRKSTDDRKRQVLSLKAQRRVAGELQQQHALRVVQRLEESQSAKEPGRPIFNRMLDDIEAGKADGILCWALNRLFRNPVDEGRVRWLLQRGIIKSIRTATREYLPQDAGVLMAVEGGQAADDLATLRRNVARGVEEKLLGGAWPAPRPLGYIYDYDRKNIVPHPRFGKVVTRVFSEYAEGGRSMPWVADRLFEFGVRTTKGERWVKSKVHWFLTNKLYMGVMVWNGKPYEGKYQPLVSPEVFQKVAARLKERSKPQKVRGLQEFPFRCIFQCSCSAMVSAQISRGNGGIYRYYRCTRAKGPCTESYLQEHELVGQCTTLLAPLALSSDDASTAHQLLESMRLEDEKNLGAQIDEVENAIATVQFELDNLTRACARLTIDDESFTLATTELLTRKASLKRKKARLNATYGSDWFEPVTEALEALQLAAKQQSNPVVQEIASLVRKTGTNHRFSDKQVSFDFAEPYASAAQLLARARAQSGMAAESGGYTGYSRTILLSLLTLLRTKFQSVDGCSTEDSNRPSQEHPCARDQNRT